MIEFRERVVSDAYVNGFRIDLSPQESAALASIHGARGEYIDRPSLIRAVGCPSESKVLDVILCHLRKKLADHGLAGAIECKRGSGWGKPAVGYRWAL